MRPKPKSGKERRLKPRFRINLNVKIKAQLIGSQFKYEFITEDLSETGLLIRHVGKGRVAFNDLSIIEAWLIPPDAESIFFYAKFVRFQFDEQCMAIRIIDIDPDQFKRYTDLIIRLGGEEVVG